ncbi:minor capsid protein [Indiicoccus explosivorum]|uniref:phage head morphogenesis protein n=1 Tax=Indiicoccus explosivorum TaxID=1917864 RepID=UPI0013906ED7|nr:minor capsid protein [Indiicoccus explosivorum]
MARKVPPTRFPYAPSVNYSKAIKRLVNELGSETLKTFDEQLKPQLKAYKRKDSLNYIEDSFLSLIQRAFAFIASAAHRIFSPSKVVTIATDNLSLINKMNLKNMKAQGRVAGVEPVDADGKLADFMELSIQQNVSYITKIKDDFLVDIERIVLNGVKKGSSMKGIREQLVQQIGFSRTRAEFIAVDQMGSIFGQLTAKRHQSMGVKEFIWRDSDDERVRKTHENLDGKTFSYANPPTVGKRKVLPGEDYRCRCVADPVFE